MIFLQDIIAAVVQLDMQVVTVQRHFCAVNESVDYSHFPFQKHDQIREICHREQFWCIAWMQPDGVDFQADFQFMFQCNQILCRDEMRKCNVKRNFRQVFRICHPFQHAVLYGLRHYGDVFFQKLCEIQIHMFHSYYCTLEFFNLCHQFRNDVLLRNLSKNSPLPEQHCTSVAAGDSDVCLSCLAGSVYYTAHDCNFDVLIHVF